MFPTPDSGLLRLIRTRLVLSMLIGGLLMTQLRCGGGGEESPAPTPGGTSASATAIARENALPGSSGWRIANPEQNGEIAGYPDRESYPAGANVAVSVSANPAGQFTYEVFRMGSYRGLGGRLYRRGGPIMAPSRPEPSFDPTTGLVVAGWPSTFSISTRHDDGTPWLTGVYLVMLTKQDGLQSALLFILRDDSRDAEVAAHFPTATYQAYNNWGGESLYMTSRGLSGGKARKVSLDRPIARQYGNGTGTFLYQEHEAVIWLEEHGYDVEYGGTADLGGDNGRIGAHRLVMLIGHEEYATMAEFDRLQEAVTRGVSLAFLTGNTLYWQIRYENNGRVIVCYKDRFEEDPMYNTNPRLTTVRFASPIVNRPENQLVGVMSDGSHIETPHDWVVTNADHWVYANTGLSNGSRLPRLVFTEWDGLVNNGLTPQGITVLASSVVPNPFTPGSRHEATIYERDRAFVFAAGTIFYSTHLRDQPAVGQMTANLLARAGARRYQAD
jgi:hypothetical protein